MTWLLPIPLVLLLGSVALLWRGLRGRRVDDHPICRRCGFDLFGRPPGSDVCSECGADLANPRAIRIGRRERRGWLLAAGGVMLAVALTLGGAGGYAIVTIKDWQPYKPGWWLVRELDGADLPARGPALTELSSRLTAGTLAQRHIDAAVDRILALQVRPEVTWDPALGDFVEDARRANKLGGERWQRFARQAPVELLEVRLRVRHGDPIPFTIKDTPARVGNRTKLQMTWKEVVATVDGVRLREQRIGGGISLGLRGGTSSGNLVEFKDYDGRLAPGKHTLAVELQLQVQEGDGPRGEGSDIAETTVRLTAPPFELLPASEQSITVVDNEELRGPMEQAMTRSSSARMSRWSPRTIDLQLQCIAAPTGIGYEVFAIVGGREQRIKFISCPAMRNHSWGASVQLPEGVSAVDTIDVIYKPSFAAAAQTTNTYVIWGREIVHKGVKVVPLAPTPTRTTKRQRGAGQ